MAHPTDISERERMESKGERHIGAAMTLSTSKPTPRRGLSRVEAAIYLGISPSKFDELRKDGRVGSAKIIDGRKVWDIRILDETFDAFPTEIDEAVEDWQAKL